MSLGKAARRRCAFFVLSCAGWFRWEAETLRREFEDVFEGGDVVGDVDGRMKSSSEVAWTQHLAGICIVTFWKRGTTRISLAVGSSRHECSP